MRGQPGTGPSFLSKYQKNDLFRVIEGQDQAIPIIEFDLHVIDEARYAEIRHSPTDSYFRIERKGKDRRGRDRYRITSNPEMTATQSRVTSSWQPLLLLVENWAGRIKFNLDQKEKYEKTPDLWEILRQAREFLFSRENTENTPFTGAEQDRIAWQLTQVKEYIRTTHQLTAAQLTRLETTLDHVEEASKRLGRKDWILLFNGAVFSLILTDLITPQIAQHVLLITVQALGHLFGHGMPPLPPP